MNVLFDTCILLDYLLNRKEFVDESESCIIAVTEGIINGYVTVKSFMDIHYVVKKSLHNESKTRKILEIVLESFVLIDSYSSDAIKALNSKIKDYEDALLEETARSFSMDYIVTRNIKDFKKSSINVVSPKQLMTLISK